jgi:serine O-acetyltransferase
VRGILPGMLDSPLIADLRHMTGGWGLSPGRVVMRAVPKVLLQPRFRAVVLYRASHLAWAHQIARPLAYWCQSRAIRAAGTEIHPAARIGPGLSLIHSVGIVIGNEVVAGGDLVLHQGVTLGHGRSGSGQPTVGDRVRIGAGATLLGQISIGDDAVIGANAVVLADVPSGSIITGVSKAAPEDMTATSPPTASREATP